MPDERFGVVLVTSLPPLVPRSRGGRGFGTRRHSSRHFASSVDLSHFTSKRYYSDQNKFDIFKPLKIHFDVFI